MLETGKLEGLHTQLDLGRPGRCAGDAQVHLLGEPLKQEDGKAMELKLPSVGHCCDKCADTSGCAGWSMDVDTSTCFLLSSLSGTWDQRPGYISGVHVNAMVTV